MKSIMMILLISIIACNDPGNSNNPQQATQPKSKEDSLYEEVIGYHDEAMPKMGKLLGYQKALQLKIDSLAGVMKVKKDEASGTLKMKYEVILEQVKSAEKGMNDWMDNFDPDPKLPSKEKFLEYWEDQEKKAKKMRDDIMISLDSAEAYID